MTFLPVAAAAAAALCCGAGAGAASVVIDATRPASDRVYPANPAILGIGDDWTLGEVPWTNASVVGATASLRNGLTRFPGGACSNYWNLSASTVVSPCSKADCAGSQEWCQVGERVSALPAGTFDVAEFLKGVAGATAEQLPVIDLNVMHFADVKPLVRAVLAGAASSGRKAPQRWELGNEYYIAKDYDCFLPNASVYASRASQAIRDIKELVPGARVAVIMQSGDFLQPPGSNSSGPWNAGMVRSGVLASADAFTLHDYGLFPGDLHRMDPSQWANAIAAWSEAHVVTIGASTEQVLGPYAERGLPVWMTEFGILETVFHSSEYFSRFVNHGGLKAHYVVGRQMAALLRQELFGVLQYYCQGGQGWGLDTGLTRWAANGTGQALEVDGTGQILAHFADRVINRADSVWNATQRPDGDGARVVRAGSGSGAAAYTGRARATDVPRLPVSLLRAGRLPCLQTIAMGGKGASTEQVRGGAAEGWASTVAALNRCNETIAVRVEGLPQGASARLVSYLWGPEHPGGYGPLPDADAPFPWVGAVPTTVRQLAAAGDGWSIPGFATVIMEVDAEGAVAGG